MTKTNKIPENFKPDWDLQTKSKTKLVVYWKDTNKYHPFYSFPNKSYHEGIRFLRKLAAKIKDKVRYAAIYENVNGGDIIETIVSNSDLQQSYEN